MDIITCYHVMDIITYYHNGHNTCISSGMVYQNVTMFGVAWSNYVKALDEWKCVDIDRLIAELHMYWEQLQVCDC